MSQGRKESEKCSNLPFCPLSQWETEVKSGVEEKVFET